MRRKRTKNTTKRTMRRMSLKRKSLNLLLLVMLVVIAVGIYYNIYNSRAESVVEIIATAIDNYAYLEEEEFKLEAKRIEENLYEVNVPENINGKNVLEILKITLEETVIEENDKNTENTENTATPGEITNVEAPGDAENETTPEQPAQTEQENQTTENKNTENTTLEETTQEQSTENKQENTTPEATTEEQPTTGNENTNPEQPTQTEQEEQTTENKNTEETEKETEQEQPTESKPEEQTPSTEQPSEEEPKEDNTDKTESTTTTKTTQLEIKDGKIQLTKNQVENGKLSFEVKYDVAILAKNEEGVYSKDLLVEKTEEERNSLEITEQTEIVYSRTLKYEDEERGKLVELKGYLPLNAEIRAEEVSQEQLKEVFGEAEVHVAYDIKIVIPIEKKAILKADETVIGKINEGNTFVAEDGTVIGQLTEENTIIKEDGTVIGEITEDGTITGELTATADELAEGLGTTENKIKLGTITEYIERNPKDFGETCEVTIKDANIATDSEVYHVKEDNSYEKVNINIQNEGSVKFEATTFSVYAVMAANDGIELAAEDGSWPRISVGDYVYDSSLFRHYDGRNNTGYSRK